jgi:mRNA-degrading endonuclease toxin of MazEF toxin-antitoxin module
LGSNGLEVFQGEIYLVPFPFLDHTSKKVRPVLILTSDGYNVSSFDVIVCGITSNLFGSGEGVIISNEKLVSGKIPKKSKVKPENVTYMEKEQLIKKVAKINNQCMSKVLEKFFSLFSQKP